MKHFAVAWLCLFLVGLSSLSLAQDYTRPEKTLDTYLEACKAGSYSRAEGCYTKSSRSLVQTLVQEQPERDPDLLKGLYEKLKPLSFRLEEVNAKRAILWPSDENVPPFFLRIQEPEEGWRIDYHFMSNFLKIDKKGWSWRNKRILGIWKSRE